MPQLKIVCCSFAEPSGPPEMVESFSVDTMTISLFWNPIRESMRNGIIMKYRIFYRLQQNDVLKLHRVGRDIASPPNVSVEGLEPGEFYKDVNSSLNSAVLHNLESFQWYIIRIGGMTTEGLGPVTTLNASCGQSGMFSHHTPYCQNTQHNTI